MEPEDIVPLHADFSPAGFQLYLLDTKAVLGLEEAEVSLSLALILMTRQDGLLVALPELALSSEVLDAGNVPGAQGIVGPSKRTDVAVCSLDEDTLELLPAQIEGRTMPVLLVDFSNEVLAFMSLLTTKEELDASHPFDVFEPTMMPLGDELVARALAWAAEAEQEEGAESRVQFYSADEVPITPPAAVPKRSAKRRGPGAGTGGEGSAKAAAAKKRPTVNQLAESLEAITTALPAITSQLQELSARTDAMERGGVPVQPVQQGINGKSQTPSRACSAQGGVLPECASIDVKEDVPCIGGGLRDERAERQGCDPDTVPRAVRRFWEDQGHRHDHMASCNGNELHAGGKSPCSYGRSVPAVRMPRADFARRGKHASRPPVVVDGGPPSFPFLSKISDSSFPSKALRTNSESEMGHHGTTVSERDGCHYNTTSGGDFREESASENRLRSTAKSNTKEEAKGRRKRKEGPRCSESGGGNMSSDDHQLQAEISFGRLLAVLPRLVLRSRTRFSSFLAKSFRILRAGTCPSSAVYPIPVPFIGLFDRQGVPKLNKRQWRNLCIRRGLHVLVIALNYLHAGLRPVPCELLGRRPTSVHLAIYKRLRALLTACDRPDSHLMPPGRSGPEFIARLLELERFAESQEVFNPDPYSSCADQKPAPSLVFGKIQEEHRFKSAEAFSPIHPHRSLDAKRLKVSGEGKWPMADFLEDILWLPFLEPLILQHGSKVTWDGPDFKRESKSENERLCQLWSSKGLLALFPRLPDHGHCCRVFNAHKNSECDRQIGDRRWVNGSEFHPQGPSALLPAGPSLTALHCPIHQKLVGAASDRKDFYHQALVTRSRAWSNALPFKFDAKNWRDTQAFEDMLCFENRPYSREKEGDRYGMKPQSVLVPDEIKHVYGGFKSLFQGDHLGVEYALSSHAQLLKDAGLLSSNVNILRHQPFPRGPMWHGLVIDDFFAISREDGGTPNQEAASGGALDIAEETYRLHAVRGSDDKTVRAADNFKVIGAEILSDEQSRKQGVILVGSPAAKRIPMIMLSLAAAKLPCISRALAARLAGNWISIFMFRRQLCCLLSSLFGFATKSAADADDVLFLPRRTADELVLSSIFGLVAMTDISVKYDNQIYATDSSSDRGAFTSLEISSDHSEVVWLGGDKRGAYTMLDHPARQILRRLGEDVDEDPVAEDFAQPPKMLDFKFDAVEICGGSGVLSDALCAEGLTVATPIDLSRSEHFNLENIKLIDWIFQMIFEGRFRSVVCEPVCRTFSPAQHPASRSYANPLGFDRNDPKTFLGNLLAFRCLAILWFSYRYGEAGLLEQPLLSKMAWLSIWRFLIQLGLQEAHIDSCAFGSPHKKPFRLLGHGFAVDELNVRCPGGHQHVRIEGQLTKASAVYHPGLAAHIAKKIAAGLRKTHKMRDEKKPCLESVVLNDLLLRPGWKVLKSWDWKKPAHINVLESRSYVGLLRHLVLRGGDCRFSALLDSRVAKGAHAKGRSSSRALRPSLQRSCAYSIAGNIHSSLGFAPTRLNTADAPTRSKPLPFPASTSILDFFSSDQLAVLHSHQFSRAIAGWIRLFILASFCLCPGESCWISGNHQFPATSGLFHTSTWTFALACLLGLFCLSQTISWTSSLWTLGRHINPPNYSPKALVLWIFSVGFEAVSAMPLTPAGIDEQRRASRRSGTQLQADRVIFQQTRNRREMLLTEFDAWLAESWRCTLEELLGGQAVDSELVCEALVAYGKALYNAGKSYGKFSETINAVTAKKSSLRKQVAAAWDLAFNWVADEPHEHHSALPLSIMLASVSLAMLWGWLREAALIAMTWTGVLRIGETLNALRSDLILPEDAAPGTLTALLNIRLPKTRGRAARHQSTRIDPSDIVALLVSAFSRLGPDEALWPWSPQRLRKRFALLLAALGIPETAQGTAQYNLSSLRPGGATFWLAATEDAEFVTRKGRWLSTRVLEIYLQETSVSTYRSRLTSESKSRIEALCSIFPEVLEKDHKVRGLDGMKRWPWMRDLPTSVWAGHSWAFDENGLRRLSSPGGSHAMQGVEVFESVGAAAAEVKPSDERITEAPIAVAAGEHPPPPSWEQKPARFMRNNLVKQSGIPNIRWNILCAWEVKFPKVDSKGKRISWTNRKFSVKKFMGPGISEAQADAAALEAAKAFHAELVEKGILREPKLRDPNFTSEVPGVIYGGVFTEKAAAEAKALELQEKDGLQRQVRPVAALANRYAGLPVFHPKVPYPGVTWEQRSQQWRACCRGRDFYIRPKDHSEAELERSFKVAVAWKKKQEKENQREKEKEGKAAKPKAKPGKKQRK
eukprot:s1156_g22.t1